MKASKVILKLFFGSVAALIVFYLCYQIYMVMYPQYRTESAVVERISDSISCRGIVVRNEAVIDEWGGSARSYLVGDGSKVAVGEAVATVYGSAGTGAEINGMRLDNLSSELAVVKASSVSSRSTATSVSNLSNSIYNSIIDIASAVSSGEYSEVYGLKTELLRLMNSYDLAVDETTDFSERIAELEERIAAVPDVGESSVLRAPSEGYFISYVDGLEDKINRESVLEMSVADISALASVEPRKDTSMCKIVSGYTWDFAAVVSASQSERFSEGLSVTLDFKYAGITDIPARVTTVLSAPDSESAVVILTCSRMNSELASLRCEQAEIRFFEYEGIKIPRSALRVEDGIVGVYVRYGSAVTFKAINTIYETEEYVVSSAGSAGGDELAMYDEIITVGRDLYVGKEI